MESPGVYRFDPDMAPDSDFEAGQLHHLAVGNPGRLLDARRTPVRLVALHLETGMFEVELLDFEDKGAHWLHPFENVGKYQFALQSRKATDTQVERFREVIRRLDQPLSISCDEHCVQQTRADLAVERDRTREWLAKESRFLASRQPLLTDSLDGNHLLCNDLQAFMLERELADMEDRVATQWASNCESGELVKGHRIVLAELGLSPFEGKIVRDRRLFDEPWSRQRRARHILTRMAFVQEVFSQCGIDRPVLYRALSYAGPLQPRNANRSFVSATFDRRVAEALLVEHDTTRTIALYRQAVPLERLFMTYLETRQFSHPFKEAEAVLIADPGNPAF
jgi:hypothetical protein